MRLLPHLLATGFLLNCAVAQEQLVIAEDEASNYSEWKSEGAGTGFGEWIFRQSTAEGESHAGNYIADTSNNTEITPVAAGNKAFGLFANGVSFESSVAFRSLNKPLQKGESFSFLMKHGDIERKFDSDDPATGAIGITLRNGNTAGSPDDYNRGARFEFGYYEGKTNYQVFDGGQENDTGVSYAEGGLAVTVTVTGDDTYDLEITTLGDKNTKKLQGRKFGGSGAIESFAVFNRDGEKSDLFVNGFQVTKPAE